MRFPKFYLRQQGQALGCRMLTWRAGTASSPTPEQCSWALLRFAGPIPELQQAFWKAVCFQLKGDALARCTSTEGALGQ